MEEMSHHGGNSMEEMSHQRDIMEKMSHHGGDEIS